MSEKYTGSTAEILAKLNERKPYSWSLGELVKQAVLANHENMVNALKEYQHTNNIAYLYDRILKEFSLEEMKQYLDQVLKFVSLNKLLYHLTSDVNVRVVQGEKYVIDEQKLTLINELIKILVEKGANLTDVNEYGLFEQEHSLNILKTHKDLFLNKNILTADRFLKLSLMAKTKSLSPKAKSSSEAISDPEKVKIQGELIKEALDRNADINSIAAHIALNTLNAHKDLLLNHPKNSITADHFLKLVFNASANDSELAQKIELLELALEKGANINAYFQNNYYSWDLKFIDAIKGVLLNSGDKSLTADNFLKLVLNTSANDSELAQKIELIKFALEKGADINSYLQQYTPSWNLKFIEAAKDALLNSGEKSLTANNFLKIVLNASANDSELAQKIELIKFALEKGADINSYLQQYTPSWNLKFIVAAKDALLNSGEKSLTTNNFLKIVINAYANDDNEIDQKIALLKFALNKGADINSSVQQNTPYWNLKFIVAAKDALLNSGEKSLTANNFLKIVLNAPANDSELAQKIELIKSALEKGADINSSVQQNTPYWNLKFIEAAKDALLNNGKKSLTTNNFLKIVINASTNDDNEIDQKIALLKFALEKGADINSSVQQNTPYWNLKFIVAAKDALLNSGEKSLTTNNFLKIVINAYANDDNEIDQKIALLKFALEKGADIKDSLQYYTPSLNLKFIVAIKEYSIKAITPENFLKLVLNSQSSDDEIGQKIALLKEAIDKGVNINDALSYNTNVGLTFLQTAKDILLNSGLNSLSANNFLRLALNIEAKDDTEVVQQRELLEEAVKKQADINSIFKSNKVSQASFSLKTIENHKEFILNNSSIPATPNTFLQLILKATYDQTPEFALSKKLIKEALELGANINKVIEKEQYLNIQIQQLGALKTILFESAKNPITPDNFMRLVLSSGDQSNMHELIKFSLDKGANVNYNLDGEYPLDRVENPELIELLKSHGGKCSSTDIDEIVEGGVYDVLWKPWLINEQKYKNLNAERAETPKIPHKMFHIWLTHPTSPQEIRSQDIASAIETKKLFAGSAEKWEHIVWTNDKNLIPESTKKLEEAGINVQSIYDYQQELKLFELVEGLIEQKKWGMASDTLRYSLVEHFGGVYADLNFIFKRDVIDETHKYNFFTMSYGDYYIDNFFFGASKKHPVIEKVLYLVERNLVSPPKYLSEIQNQDSRVITDMGTANPTYLAYYTEANKHGNVDVVYPLVPRSLLNNEDADEEFTPMQDTESFETMMKEYIQKIVQKCPEKSGYAYVSEYLNSHEICGLANHLIGHDSSDGLTWL